MTARRFVPAATFLAAFSMLIGLISSAKAQKKDGLDEATTALMDILKKSAEDKDYRKDPKCGGGKTPFEEAPTKPKLLVGVDLYIGTKDKSTQYVRGVRAVYMTPDGKTTLGTVHGWTAGTSTKSEKAKAGYAVAGFKTQTEGGEIAGMSIVFAKITESGLDMTDTYDSKYYGHNDPDTARKVVCTGEPIVGIHGMVADNARSHDFAFGLIVLGKDAKK